MKEEFDAQTELDVYKRAYLHLMHENEKLKNELWKSNERIKRARKDIERMLNHD